MSNSTSKVRPPHQANSKSGLEDIRIGRLCEYLFTRHYRNAIARNPQMRNGVLDIATTVASGIWKNSGMTAPTSPQPWRLEIEETLLIGVITLKPGIELNDRQLHIAGGVIPETSIRGYIAHMPERLSDIAHVAIDGFDPEVRDVLFFEKSGSLIFTLDPPSRPWLELRAELESQI